MDTYKITIKFKNKQYLELTSDLDINPREEMQKNWERYRKEGAMAVGDYIIDINEILYVKIENDKLIAKGKIKKRKVKKGNAKRAR